MIETINANCLDVLKETAANSQDLIFCDPPYALGSDVIIRKDGKPDYRKAVDFMAKWQQPDGYFWEQWFAEAFRVLRYGGRVVMFGMDRQLMLNKYYACFAGFAEQQSLYWYTISGFPKSADLAKNIDKCLGVGVKEYGGIVTAGHDGRKAEMRNPTNSDHEKHTPSTDLAQKYNGMKYSIAPLKQTNETILVFQKPYKTGSCLHDTLVYENGDDTCMCGAVDVEGNRCGFESENDKALSTSIRLNSNTYKDRSTISFKQNFLNERGHENGRYPAQTYCDDEAAKVLDRQSGISKSTGGDGSKYKSDTNIVFKKETIVNNGKNGLGLGDTGGCSRILHRCNYDLNDYDIYHYCPKVSNKERNEGCEALNEKRRATLAGADNDGVLDDVSERFRTSPAKNHHPTVKPIALLKKIIALFKTPNELHVFDPFMGSGSMGIACIELGVSYTGVELDAEYYTIAQTRLAHHNTKNKSKLF